MSAISQTFEINPSSRPTAAELYQMISQYSRIPSQESTLLVTPPPEPSDTEDWGGNLPWAQPNPTSFALFRHYGSTPATDWVVFTVVVNRRNTRIVIVSSDVEQETLSIKLCNPSGDVIWHKNSMILNTIQDIVIPAFSEDGECMVVYLEGWIEVIDTRLGRTIDLISIQRNESIQPTAMAIGQNSKVLAVSSKKEGTAVDASLTRVTFLMDGPHLRYLQAWRMRHSILMP